MNYQIVGDIMPAVEVKLNRGESMYTQSGGMAWMSEGLTVDSNIKGGFARGIGRMFTGESLFMATYTAHQDNATIAFASTVPGKIIPVRMDGMRHLICQKDAFLCAEPQVNLQTVFSKRFTSGLFGGEGFFLQEVTGNGMVFLEVDGDVIERELAPGEVLKVDTGNVVAFEGSVHYDIETVKGLKNVFFGGEGLFLTRLTGPGKVYLQTMNYKDFASKIIRLMPSK